MNAAIQPALFVHQRDPDSPPLVLKVAIGRLPNDVSVVDRPYKDDPTWWDRQYPSCAPHRIATVHEVIA